MILPRGEGVVAVGIVTISILSTTRSLGVPISEGGQLRKSTLKPSEVKKGRRISFIHSNCSKFVPTIKVISHP